MAHEIEIVDGKAAFAYNVKNGLPWHGLGHKIDGGMTPTEAHNLVCNWGLKKQPAFILGDDGLYHEVPGQFFVVRDGNQVVSKTSVGPHYQEFQNSDAVRILDILQDEDMIELDTAGSLFNGRRIFFSAKIKGDPIEVVPNDPVYQNIQLILDHSGKGADKIMSTNVRIVCNNTFGMALGEARNATMVDGDGNVVNPITRTNHRTSGDAKVDKMRDDALRILGVAKNKRDEFIRFGRMMAATQINSEGLKGLFDTVLPPDADGNLTAQNYNKRNRLLELFVGGIGQDNPRVQGTVWAAFNAVTEYADHYLGTRVTKGNSEIDLKMNSYIDGSSANMKEQAFNYLLNYVQAA